MDHGADSGIFIHKGAFAIIVTVKTNARVGGFDKRLGDGRFMGVIYFDIKKIDFVVESYFSVEF